MKHTFALTTRQVSQLARVEPYVIYSSLARHDAWHGLKPAKLPNKRLLWRANEVHAALGIVPEWKKLAPGERAFANFLELEAHPLTADIFKVGQAFLNTEPDHGRDPAFYADEGTVLVEFVRAYCERVGKVMPAMEERDKARARNALRAIVSAAGSFDSPSEENGHD